MEKTSDHPPSSILHPRPVFLAGPTAVGKSALALALAEKIGGEIISVDSMQVYRGLDIGTAKPTAEERRRVPHHLIDICNLNEAFDAAQFVHHAQQAVAEIQARGHVPIFCGGTGLYFKAYISGLGEAPATDAKIRAELEATPLETLISELRERDPETYEKIDRQNPRRVVRAVEVIRLTGKKFSAQRSEWTPDSRLQTPDPTFYCFTRPTPDMHQRINLRVDEMFARGL
ncbi:MAG: tRNA (adenosine(37)-N6)-dimethylallyltransferase MiaA, partial [Verrucomicrobia bacterium]|nr:tRNA (adenosine(37)-N6)-dimethylallyltransferase MiaA [Verrucomicrobiota bacterium]